MYIQGFIVPVPADKQEAYRDVAEKFWPIVHDFGATEHVECWEADVSDGKQTDFRRAVKTQDGEKVVFAWVAWPDRATCDASHEKMMSDPRMKEFGVQMPFDGKRMVYGGFEPLLEEGKPGGGYVDGFVAPVPKDKREAYREVAAKAAKVFLEHGALRDVEAWGVDVPVGEVTSFPRSVDAQDGETVVFSFVEWPDEQARNDGWKKVMEDERMTGMDMPFDGKRMFWGEFFAHRGEGALKMSGMPIWYELMTPDPGAVAPFYRATLGWEIPADGHDMPNGSQYREIMRGDGGHAGGVLTLTPQMAGGGARPAWMVYFEVRDVDAAVAKAQGLGASVHMPPMTMAGVGRMAMIADPQGAPFYVMDPMPPADDPDAQSDVFKANAPGHAWWNELQTTDEPASTRFYTDLFGWSADNAMPMGEKGDYRFVETDGKTVGAINPWMAEWLPVCWLPYFGVADIDATKAAAVDAGGTIRGDIHEVPGGDFIFTASDPAGAPVGFVGPRN